MKNILLCILLANFINHTQAATTLTLRPAQIKQMQIQWGALQRQQSHLSASYPAEVVQPPMQTRVVTAPQAGLITKLNVSVGDTVKQGQIIGELSSPDLLGLQSQFLQNDTQARLNEQRRSRDQALFKDGIIAERRMQETQSAYEQSQALRQESEQSLKLAGMSEGQIQTLARQHTLQNKLKIIAPISGQMMEQQQSVGARVDMAMPIFTISKLKPLWLMIQLPISQAQQIAVGSSVHLPKLGLTAKVETILRQLNKNNQTTQVRAVISEGSEQLSVGQIVEVALVQQNRQNSFTVPVRAVVRQGERSVIFVQQGQTVQVVPVTVLQEQGQLLTIQGPLRGNEQIAIEGTAALKGHWLGLGGD